jgi:hypothetical protein
MSPVWRTTARLHRGAVTFYSEFSRCRPRAPDLPEEGRSHSGKKVARAFTGRVGDSKALMVRPWRR